MSLPQPVAAGFTVPSAGQAGQGVQAGPGLPSSPTNVFIPGGEALPASPGVPSAAAVPSAAPPPTSWLPPTVPVYPTEPSANETASGAGGPAAAAAVPPVAEDSDLIEKEWVDQAKEIVSRTRKDPYQQTKELHKLRSEYMKKRYDKALEAGD